MTTSSKKDKVGAGEIVEGGEVKRGIRFATTGLKAY
jgi:hypothetical protein